ncbi:MAG: hypothetical protein IKX14_03955, partial [Neisseriaceae bacterium]|nr:hypothetical protein [Neisseriaceae bacterium]
VDSENRIVSTGYNGAPRGYDDDKDMTWEREGSFLETKYAYVAHSELNAILNSKIPVAQLAGLMATPVAFSLTTWVRIKANKSSNKGRTCEPPSLLAADTVVILP